MNTLKPGARRFLEDFYEVERWGQPILSPSGIGFWQGKVRGERFQAHLYHKDGVNAILFQSEETVARKLFAGIKSGKTRWDAIMKERRVLIEPSGKMTLECDGSLLPYNNKYFTEARKILSLAAQMNRVTPATEIAA